jgi:hypothetical protein
VEIAGANFIMRVKASILVFIFALVISFALAQRRSVIEWLWPSFTRAEAAGKVGHRVRYRHTDEFIGMKCPPDGGCKQIADGERGTIIDLYPVSDGSGYFLTVAWDEPKRDEPFVSYWGRYSSKALVEE